MHICIALYVRHCSRSFTFHCHSCLWKRYYYYPHLTDENRKAHTNNSRRAETHSQAFWPHSLLLSITLLPLTAGIGVHVPALEGEGGREGTWSLCCLMLTHWNYKPTELISYTNNRLLFLLLWTKLTLPQRKSKQRKKQWAPSSVFGTSWEPAMVESFPRSPFPFLLGTERIN